MTKTITVPEEVYLLLEMMKLPGEEIGDTIPRLCGVRSRDKEFKKALGKVIAEDAEILERLVE